MSGVPGTNNTAHLPLSGPINHEVSSTSAPDLVSSLAGPERKDYSGPQPTELQRAMYSCGEEFSKQRKLERINLSAPLREIIVLICTCLKGNTLIVWLILYHSKLQIMEVSIIYFGEENPHKLYIKTQSVPRSKHTPSRI